MYKTLKFVGAVLYILVILFEAWVAISFFDIITHDLEGMKNFGQYLDWNFFVIFFK